MHIPFLSHLIYPFSLLYLEGSVCLSFFFILYSLALKIVIVIDFEPRSMNNTELCMRSRSAINYGNTISLNQHRTVDISQIMHNFVVPFFFFLYLNNSMRKRTKHI